MEEARVGEQDEGSWEEGGEGCRLVFGLDPAVYQQRGKIAPQGCVSDYEDGTRKTWKEKKGETRLRPWEAGQREGFDNSSSSINLSREGRRKSKRRFSSRKKMGSRTRGVRRKGRRATTPSSSATWATSGHRARGGSSSLAVKVIT